MDPPFDVIVAAVVGPVMKRRVSHFIYLVAIVTSMGSYRFLQ